MECSLCKNKVDESAAILTMGGFGNPRYVCSECDTDLTLVTSGKDVDEITSAIDRISKKMTKSDVGDRLVLQTVENIMTEARARAEKIKLGEYDFSDDDTQETEEEYEVPEELLESEEDKEIQEKENKKNEKLDKITNIICLVILIIVLGFIGYRFLSAFFF